MRRASLANSDFGRSEQENQRLTSLRQNIEANIVRYLAAASDGPTPVPGLGVARLRSPLAPTTYLYEPSLCISARGAKRVLLGDQGFVYDENRFLLTAVGLPTVIAVDASPRNPYVGLQVLLDLELARDMIAGMDTNRLDTAQSADPGIATGPVTEELLDAVGRLVKLLDTPRDIPILAALLQREILYRVLSGPQGSRLRQIARLDSQGHRVAKAIAWLRANFARKLRIKELARVSGMGLSTLHRHFHELTTMSPLQFQKQLRLHEARRLMLAERLDAGSSALRVGYESAAQFSRDYRRLFGQPPMRDIRSLQADNT